MGGHDHAMEWTEDCEKFFLEILAERVKRHVNGSSVFTLTDWFNMDEQIFLKFAIRYGPDKLKGKYHRLRIRHIKFGELIDDADVKWDPLSGKVVADDTVWDKFCQRDKSFKAFKTKGCKLYPLLTEVFGASTYASRTSEGHRVESAGGEAGESEGTESGNIKRKSGGDLLGMRRMKTSSGNDKAGESEGTESGNKKRKSRGDMLGMRRMKTSSGNDKYEAFLDVWKQSMMVFTDAWSQTMAEDYSIDECMAVLEATDDVSTTSYNKALTYFLEPDWRKMFLLMPKHRRKGWLDSMQK
ncbi:L10-interacting MYB domain-containing protein [Tanacetum coccineum]